MTSHDVAGWTRSFLARLDAVSAPPAGVASAPSRTTADSLASGVLAAGESVLLLDYDGTLVPIAAEPHLAQPDEEILSLLRSVAGRNDVDVHVVSGRDRTDMTRWLGRLPISLHAEHGLWSRSPGSDWSPALEIRADWKPRVRRILEDFEQRVPGSLIEEKSAGLAWHYRRADPEFGSLQAKELRLHLHEVLSNNPVVILRGHKVIEVRQQGVHKGLVLARLGTALGAGRLLVALGDDQTDEDLFAALPAGAVSVRVGAGSSRATHRFRSHEEVRRFLALLSP